MSVLQIYADVNSSGGGSGGGGDGGSSDSGTKYFSYTENGVYTEDVTGYAEANITVDVPSELPTGTLDIVRNGSYDVTNFATAKVAVPTSSGGGDIKWSARAANAHTPLYRTTTNINMDFVTFGGRAVITA